jgi:hypothetical protein
MRVRAQFTEFLFQEKAKGKKIVAYGAPAKGNTFLNYCGVRADLVDYTVDRSHFKQGHLLPGTRIPIHDPSKIFETKPDYIVILPWNLKQEIVQQMVEVKSWGAKFVVAIPELQVF